MDAVVEVSKVVVATTSNRVVVEAMAVEAITVRRPRSRQLEDD